MTKTVSSNSRLPRSSDRGAPRRAVAAVAAGLLMLLSLLVPAGLAAQDAGGGPRSPVLVVDFDQVFRLSQHGQDILQEFDSRSRALADEIARIDAEMAAEEKALTERRASLSAEEFRALADAFDTKVQELRAQQDARAQELNRDQSEARLEFRQATFPILGQLMLDAGAVLVVEKRNVLVFNDAIDVSEVTARRLDEAYEGRAAETEDAPAGVTAPANDAAPDAAAEPTAAPSAEPAPAE